jgi:hypothetical protein
MSQFLKYCLGRSWWSTFMFRFYLEFRNTWSNDCRLCNNAWIVDCSPRACLPTVVAGLSWWALKKCVQEAGTIMLKDYYKCVSVRIVDDCTIISFLLFNNIFSGRQPRQDAKVFKRFRDLLRSHFFYSWPLKMGPTDCPETSVRNYHYSLCNDPEERSSHLLSDGSLKSRTTQTFFPSPSNIPTIDQNLITAIFGIRRKITLCFLKKASDRTKSHSHRAIHWMNKMQPKRN